MTKEEKATYNKVWYKANLEKVKARVKAYREAHPEECRARAKAYKKAHPERARVWSKTWRDAHPEYQKAYEKAWAKDHPEKIRAKRRTYYKSHLEKCRVYARAYNSRERGYGFNMLNACFPCSVAHHVNDMDVVFIPEEIHLACYVRLNKEKHRSLVMSHYGSLENMINGRLAQIGS